MGMEKKRVDVGLGTSQSRVSRERAEGEGWEEGRRHIFFSSRTDSLKKEN